MKLIEAREQFIEAWGVLGTSWGINKTMAQILAVLIISPEDLSVEQIMKQLQISRGNVSMNLRTLMDWKLVRKSFKKGERKEYFYAEKDIWALARTVAAERRKRELDPLIQVIHELKNVELDSSEESKTFKKSLHDINDVVSTADLALKKFTESDDNWIIQSLLKILKSKY